jgi:hypothetical protein
VLAGRGDNEDAARLWGAAQRLDAEHEALIPPIERARYDRYLARLDAAEAELAVDDAVARALELARG